MNWHTFIRRFAWSALEERAEVESARGRSELAAELLKAAEACNAVEKHLSMAGALLRPHINPHVKIAAANRCTIQIF